MIDFILFVFICLVASVGFYAGLWCGRTYQTVAVAWAAGKAWFKEKL